MMIANRQTRLVFSNNIAIIQAADNIAVGTELTLALAPRLTPWDAFVQFHSISPLLLAPE